METFRLTSMTDFVLNINKIYLKELGQDFDTYNLKKLNLIESYANFLKQPLKLEMFIVCDENGTVLEEPERRCKLIGFDEQHYDFDDEELKIYCEAKEKVLFKGFEVKDYYAEYTGENEMIYIDEEFCENMTIEKFLTTIISEIELTESALKQIGIDE